MPETIVNEKTGERNVILESNEELFRYDIFVPAGSQIIPRHIHELQDETVEVMAGEISLEHKRAERILKTGETVTIPKGEPHNLWNHTSNEVQLRFTFVPALESETFLRQIVGLANDGKTDDKGLPQQLQMMVMVGGRFKGYIYLGTIPVWLQKFFAVVFSPIGRLRGYKDYYPQYDKEQH